MKRWICILLMCIVCFSSCSNEPAEEYSLEEPNATLVVFGKEVEGEYHARVDYEENNYEFPLIVFAEAIGAKIERKSSRIVDIVFEDTTYRLNIPKKELVDRNSNKGNILVISPGATKPGMAYATEDDVIVDGRMSSYFLDLRGIILHIDYENAVIYLEYNQSKNDVTKTAI